LCHGSANRSQRGDYHAVTAVVRRAIRAAGAHPTFLPPYSPDLNPIEQAFAKLKHLMRKAANRSIEAFWRSAGELIASFTPQEHAHHFVN
jgi:transposase